MVWLGVHAQWALAFLPIQHWQMANGTQIYFVENHDLPILDLSVEFPAGSSTDTTETSGRASMVQRLMSMGAGGLSEDQIAETLADVGAELSGSFDLDRAGLSLRTLSSGCVGKNYSATRICGCNIRTGAYTRYFCAQGGGYQTGSYC